MGVDMEQILQSSLPVVAYLSFMAILIIASFAKLISKWVSER